MFVFYCIASKATSPASTQSEKRNGKILRYCLALFTIECWRSSVIAPWMHGCRTKPFIQNGQSTGGECLRSTEQIASLQNAYMWSTRTFYVIAKFIVKSLMGFLCSAITNFQELQLPCAAIAIVAACHCCSMCVWVSVNWANRNYY